MLLRLCYTTRRYCHRLFPHHHRHHNPARLFSSSTSRNPDEPPNNLKNSDQVPHPPSVLRRRLNPQYSVPGASSLPRAAVIALSGTLASALIALYVVVSTDCDDKSLNPVHNGVRHAVLKSTESFRKLLHRPKQTGVAASVLWHSLSSILSSANHEVRSGSLHSLPILPPPMPAEGSPLLGLEVAPLSIGCSSRWLSLGMGVGPRPSRLELSPS